MGAGLVTVSSLYVSPEHRGRGVAGRALREGDRLGWTESPRLGELIADGSREARQATGTFALALATHGWPLIRGEAEWDARHASVDGGDPEGLAYKIELFEAIDRRYGFEVRAPRIPGIEYRDYDAIE